ncbi:MAG: GNAT family N-acetyltransferase [Sulfuritalea sp.]|nr:GNAT family N-acetyltransferase [Sulfuritalea sp.]
MSALVVRQAIETDQKKLAPLFDAYRRFYGAEGDIPAASAFLADRFARGESAVFIAFEGEVAVGFTQLYPSFSSVSLARIFILNDLFVDESARRKGVVAQLIAAAVDYSRTEAAARLTLSTARSNLAAQALYESLGWKRDDRFLVYNFSLPAQAGSAA